MPSKESAAEEPLANAAGHPGHAAAEGEGGTGVVKAKRGSSPYATGGGGVTFAQLVASVYLASMLTGGRRREISDLQVRTVGFQNGPEHPIDDLLITCGNSTIEATLAVACRATPNFVHSDDETVKLVKSLLAEVEEFDSDAHQVAVATAGRSAQWDDLARLCDIARAHARPASFKASMDVDGRWTKQVRGRFDQFQKMVSAAMKGAVTADEVLRVSWRLLGRLHVLGFAVQSPDESDRTAVAMTLDGVADASGDGVALRDRLETLAAGYDSRGGVVDLNLVRRDLHGHLNVAATRTRQAWKVLEEHRDLAVGGVRTTIGDGAPGGPVELAFAGRRTRLSEAILDAGLNNTGLLVSGESGIGKSALTLSAVAELEAADRAGFEAAVVNFRSLPQSSLDLRGVLGVSVQDVLTELSAPSKVLVIDAADAALERNAALLSDLVLAAKAAGVGVVAVSSDVASEFVREQLSTGFASTAPFKMDPLGDDDVAVVADAFPLLRPVLRDLPKNSLLRRPVVLDLLARTGVKLEGTLSEWDALNLVWTAVVRGEGRPGVGSAEARAQTLLAVAAAAMHLPAELRPSAGIDFEAVDALRRDHLLAPANPYREAPEFAHDEIRRYATAILLVRAADMTGVLDASAVPRLAMSAATLACKGLFKDIGKKPDVRFVHLLSQFKAFAAKHGARWADVPVEAVMETPDAYECLKAALDDKSSGLALADAVRIVNQRHKVGGLIDVTAASAVVRILLDYNEPWDAAKDSFELLADWLQALVVADEPAGNRLRVALRARLFAHWKAYPPSEPAEGDLEITSLFTGMRPRRRRRGDLDYHVTGERFVECLALLGADIDDDIEACLRAIAEDAPAFLAPAADSPLSARAVGQHDPELLAMLIEAYYVDDEESSWHRDEGVRGHQGRWTSVGGPFCAYWFGGFWQLCHYAHFQTWVRVLNNILNSGANARVRRNTDGVSLPADTHGDVATEDAGNREERGFVLDLDGTPRLYVGDSATWSWCRGTTVGPYSAMSALQAVERVLETWLDQGAPVERVIEIVLEGCKNLAMPGMLFGVLVRHLDKVGDALDRFLAEPVVWELEFARATYEYSGLAARTEGLVNLDRRKWTPREVAAVLLTTGGEERVEALKKVGHALVGNGDLLGLPREATLNWAASLDAGKYKLTQVPEGLQIEVEPPPEVRAAQEEQAAYQELVNTSLRLQNRYWGSAKHDDDYVPPTSEEIAADLVAGKSLLETEDGMMPTRPADAVAHVIRVAVERATAGDLTAFGDQSGFATEFVLAVASWFRDAEDQRDEGQYFDLSADRAIAQALPAFLTPALAEPLAAAGGTVEGVADAGLAMAGKASVETRLFLARGCDVVWTAPCEGDPCIHGVALDWLLETARSAEIGPWDQGGQRRAPVRIDGDVVARLEQLPGDSISISLLDAVIRGLGVAAAADHCRTNDAVTLLHRLLGVQSRAMVVHEDKGWTADHRGDHTLIAARALLNVYSNDGDTAPVLEHLDVLRADASLMSNLLHGLAAAGAENEWFADAARRLWPAVFGRGLSYADSEESPYRDHHWGDWAASALLPSPLAWAKGMYNECAGAPLDWVRAEDLLDLIDDWLPIAQGEGRCLDSLIGLLRRLPVEVQVRRGLAWVTALCVQDGTVAITQSWSSNVWLKEVRQTAEELEVLDEWQRLVDSLVVAGNEGLAPYSR
ncbi:hypothetical protein [Cellulosimicrobium sp. KWT-B]|uniref:hypothetical protein n=1 Tax=Cellulosimicrobium sp. KWT-B TaxID=1981152 RepID=UPI0018EA0ADF|nr:hypothetical protein [Cellulosimicrobium sp. KWT-B]